LAPIVDVGEWAPKVRRASPPLWGRLSDRTEGGNVERLSLPGCCWSFAAFLFLLAPAHADEASLRAIIAKFATPKGFKDIEAVVRELAATGDPRRPVLSALSDGNLYVRKSDSAVF
jgi:hypothetical protein